MAVLGQSGPRTNRLRRKALSVERRAFQAPALEPGGGRNRGRRDPGGLRAAVKTNEVIMKSKTEHLTLRLPERMGFLNITPRVERIVSDSGIQEGLCLVNAMHITASVFINDDESGLHEDYKRWLEWLAPYDPSPERYHHNRTGEDNGDAHHKRQIMGREVVVAVTRGRLDFGPWEQIFYGEFDGRRDKRVLVKVIGE
jgi:secondary thiamine-phosphate synthase enzyme